MRILLFTTLFVLVSCGAVENDMGRRRPTVSAYSQFGGFQSYISEFDSYKAKYLNNSLPIDQMKVVMVDQIPSSSTAVGSCNTLTKEVQIKRSFWNSSDYYTRKQIMFHELGHCYLNLGHNSATQNGVPLSIMYPSVFDSTFFKQYEASYIEALFTGRTAVIQRMILNYRASSKEVFSKHNVTICNHKH